MHFVFDIVSYILGVAMGSAAMAFSSKYFGWFNKEVKAIETKVGLTPK